MQAKWCRSFFMRLVSIVLQQTDKAVFVTIGGHPLTRGLADDKPLKHPITAGIGSAPPISKAYSFVDLPRPHEKRL